MSRTLWTVTCIDHDEPMTVIAESAEDAISHGMEYDDASEEARESYHAEPETPSDGLRWVGFESASDAEWQAQALIRAGVTARIYQRTTLEWGCAAHLWEIGARDEDWCRDAEGMLCGGER